MISIHPLGRGPAVADYYLTRRECDDLGYYVGHDQLPGRWVGSGAAALGLRHDFGSGDGELLRGFLSSRGLDGSVLVPSVMRRDDKGQPYDARRVGFDVTCSAPKSVSVLYALGNADVAGQVAAAHRTAVREALEVLERLSARAARGHQGDGHRARRIPTSGLIGAAFDHDTSRLLDPQLHTHVVIANVVCGCDGRWSALDSQTMVRQATTVSYLYQAVLRAELTRRLGVAWTDVEKGIAEIDGIPREVMRAFSKRRDQIERALADRGLSGTAAAQAACLATRPAKQHEDAGTLRHRWLAEATRTLAPCGTVGSPRPPAWGSTPAMSASSCAAMVGPAPSYGTPWPPGSSDRTASPATRRPSTEASSCERSANTSQRARMSQPPRSWPSPGSCCARTT